MLILFSQLRKWKKLRWRPMREATTRVPSISDQLLVTDEHLKVHWEELSHRPKTLRNTEIRRSALSEPVQRHRTTLVDVRLILAVTPGKVLRTKPQDILIRLPIQNLEAVA